MYIYLVSHLFSHLVLTKGLSARGIHIGHILYNSPNHLGGKKKSLEGSFLPAGRGFDTPALLQGHRAVGLRTLYYKVSEL